MISRQEHQDRLGLRTIGRLRRVTTDRSYRAAGWGSRSPRLDIRRQGTRQTDQAQPLAQTSHRPLPTRNLRHKALHPYHQEELLKCRAMVAPFLQGPCWKTAAVPKVLRASYYNDSVN